MPGKGKPFEKGHRGLKPIGAENKTTKKAKELVVELVEYGLPRAMQKLDEIENPKEYLDALSKFIAYVVPKKTDITSKDQPLEGGLNLSNLTYDQLVRLAEGNKERS
jgi:hypothetical protein